MADRPSVSIVMPSLQQRAFLQEALESVLTQSGVEVELIVQDAGSTDGSRELLGELRERHGECLRLYFESDQGQSDAVNRGLERARSSVMGWLNSDDRLAPGALETVVPILSAQAGPAWVYGRASVIDARGVRMSGLISGYKNWRSRRFSRLKLLTENFIPQMAVFWNRALWERAGGLDPERHLDMDYDLWLRFSAIAEPIVLDCELADFRVHDAAKGTVSLRPQLDAAIATAREHAVGLGMRGRAALLIHRLYSLRTRILYRWLKPQIR